MVNKRWSQYAAQQYRQNILNNQPKIGLTLSPVKRQPSTGLATKKATQFFTHKGFKKQGCCK